MTESGAYSLPVGYGFEGSAETMDEKASLSAFMSLAEALLNGLLSPTQVASYTVLFYTLHNQNRHWRAQTPPEEDQPEG